MIEIGPNLQNALTTVGVVFGSALMFWALSRLR